MRWPIMKPARRSGQVGAGVHHPDRQARSGRHHRPDSTTLVVVEVDAGGQTGLGYTYASASLVPLIGHMLAKAIEQRDAFDIPGAWLAMQRSVRNLGREGLAATAISAVDCALWDLKAKLLDLPLARLLGRMREAVPIYGSGGLRPTDDDLREQFSRWVAETDVAG